MKILLYLPLVMLCLLSSVSAQSGRRIQGMPTPSPTPDVEVTQSVAEQRKQNEIGYSESAPNAPRSLIPRERQKDEKKNDKKSDKNASAPVSTTADQTKTEGGDDEPIKVETNLVTMPVSVTDRNGFYISDLMQKNFKIFEDGVEQEVAYFATSESPFTVVLLIDVSASTELKIEQIQAAAIAFVDQLKPQDQVMVVEFDSSVRFLTEVTGDRAEITKAIRKTRYGGGTSLYEAVDRVLGKRLKKIPGRKAIVLFTDGVDTTSVTANYESTIEDAEESEAVIFPIYYNTFLDNIGLGGGGVMSSPPILSIPGSGGQNTGTTAAEYARGRAYLNELASATGGRVFRSESTPGGLTAAFESIAEELRRQYSLGYYPANPGKPGDRRQLRVRVDRPRLIIRTRDSYIVGK
ncbi:MAG: VWA domain-containing protein [Acidobacteria bacterium]|nr:VWA domain-containing protein [Acidobacteriota bacterium]